jgi:hypothetical protein
LGLNLLAALEELQRLETSDSDKLDFIEVHSRELIS